MSFEVLVVKLSVYVHILSLNIVRVDYNYFNKLGTFPTLQKPKTEFQHVLQDLLQN